MCLRKERRMPGQKKYKLYYFDFRGRGELLRLLFTYAGVAFDDVRIDMEQWPRLKPAVPMCQLPVLEVDGKIFCQSMAIGRLIAREHALAGSNNMEMAKADMLAQGVSDMYTQMGHIFQLKLQGQEALEELWSTFIKDHLHPFLTHYEKFLNAMKSTSCWCLVGESTTWADIAVAEYLSMCQDYFQSDILQDYPKLRTFVDRVFTLPRLKEYVENRRRSIF